MKPVMNNMSVVVSRVLQSVVRYFNPFMLLVLGSRAHRMMSGRLIRLSFTGRRTGRSYTTPVSYVREGTDLLVPGGRRCVGKPDDQRSKGAVARASVRGSCS